MANKITQGSKNNPRSHNGHLRRKYRARLKAQGGPCGICQGRLGEIHYDEPSDWKHPLSFVIDEIIPVSRWKEFGYDSPEAVARDWNNLQAAHWCCNQAKSNKIINDDIINQRGRVGSLNIGEQVLYGNKRKEIINKVNVPDGKW